MKSKKTKRDPKFSCHGLEVRDSPGRGRGVFATKTFKKADIVEIAPVLEIPADQARLLQVTLLGDYTFLGDGPEEQESSFLALGYGSLYNHDTNYNAGFVASKEALVVVAEKDIAAGEEVVIDYGWDNYEWEIND